MTSIYTNPLSVIHIFFECAITTNLFVKDGYDFNVCNNVKGILYNTNVKTSVVKFIVHIPVGKLINTTYRHSLTDITETMSFSITSVSFHYRIVLIRFFNSSFSVKSLKS